MRRTWASLQLVELKGTLVTTVTELINGLLLSTYRDERHCVCTTKCTSIPLHGNKAVLDSTSTIKTMKYWSVLHSRSSVVSEKAMKPSGLLQHFID